MTSPQANNILSALPSAALERLAKKLRPINLTLGETLYLPDQKIEHVFFPTAGIVSLLAVFEDGNTVEAGMIGREGMLGLSVALGAKTTPHHALVQGNGHALKMTTRDFKAELQNGSGILDPILRFSNSLFIQVAQTAACNRVHTLEQRLARWLLLTHDRLQENEFMLTQEFLSRMLGVRRAGVSVAANTLREMHAIDYRRGTVIIQDRKGLEEASCGCYRLVKTEYDRLVAR